MTKQVWTVGSTVNVGFMANMFVEAARGKEAVVRNPKGKFFRVTAHNGCHGCQSRDEAFTSFWMATGEWN